MPMDPFFEGTLGDQRRQVIAQIRERVRALLPGLRRSPKPAAPAAPKPAAPAAPAVTTPKEPKAPKPAKGTPAWEQRNSLLWDRKLQKRVGIDGPELRTSEHTVPVTGFPDVRVRLYLPDSAGDAPVPVVLAFFGGAFHVGGIDYASIDANYRRRTADSGVATLAVDYALAPDHRFPTPVEQGYAALDWLVANAAELGVDPARIAVNGTSSGGNIAAAVTLANRARAAHPLRLQILEVPVVDLTGGHVDFAATRAMRIPGFAARIGMRKIQRRYLGHLDQARTELASPLLADDLTGLPEAIILTAEFDALRGDGAAYADRLRRAGVEASCVQYQGIVHEAPMYTGVVPAARRWHRDVVATLRLLHEPAG